MIIGGDCPGDILEKRILSQAGSEGNKTLIINDVPRKVLSHGLKEGIEHLDSSPRLYGRGNS